MENLFLSVLRTLSSQPCMKKLVLVPAILLSAILFSSCGVNCFQLSCVSGGSCGTKKYVEIEEVEWIEEEVYTEGGKGGTVKVRRPIVTIVRKAVKCAPSGSWYCADDDCGDVPSSHILRRATAQGASGEPHIGLIPTMKVLAADDN